MGGSVINDLAVDPSNPSHLLAAVGHWYPTDQPKGLYESFDKGDTWEKITFNPDNDILATAIAFDNFDPLIIYVGAGFHLYRSRDGGTTWTHLEATSDRDFMAAFVPFGDQARLFIGTGEGVYDRPMGVHSTFYQVTGGAMDYSNLLDFAAQVADDGGAVSTETALYLLELPAWEVADNPSSTLVQAFRVYAYQSGTRLASLAFNEPVSVTLEYPDDPRMREDALQLLMWNGASWEEGACGDYSHDPANNRLTVPICEAGQFGLFSPYFLVALPLVKR
jgi:hypothetical protein